MIRLTPAAAAAALAAVALAGCGRNGEIAAGSSNICTPFPSAGSNGAVVITDPAAALDDCLHRWGYSLAAAKDPADMVAGAVVAACGTSLSHWNQQSLNQAPADQQDPSSTSLTTGQSGDVFSQRAQYAQSRALFYVVQARAGGCAAPAGKPPAGEP
jgi:hypothetical protein